MAKEIEIPFGAQDSELKGWTCTIPEGYTARIEGNNVIVEPSKSDNKKVWHIIPFHRDVVYSAMCNSKLDSGLRCNLQEVYNILKDIVAQTSGYIQEKPGLAESEEDDKIIVVPLSCFKAQNCISNCHLTEKDKRFIRVLIDIIKEDYSDYSFLSPTENENEYEYIETDEMVEMLEKIIK